MVRTLTRLLADRELRRVGRFATGSTLKPSDVWTAVAVDRSGLPMVQAATQGGALVMRIGAAPESFVAAAAVRALLAARAGATSRPDQEVLRTPAETLSAWSRPAAGVDSDAWRRVESSDSRWFWLLAVLLLLLEGRIRRAKASLSAEVRDAA
jgi:hypothetical protein